MPKEFHFRSVNIPKSSGHTIVVVLQNPKKVKTYYKTIVLSDLHLGTNASQAKKLCRFLKHHRCETLILNGDIIDGWQLKKSGSWKKKHTRFFRMVLKRASKKMRVIYLRGNHDDFLDEILPFTIGNFTIARDYIHESFGKRYYVVHGDLFDTVTTKLKWIAKLGDTGYTFLLWLNRHYNRYREKRGLPYYSLSQVVKAKVKGAVSFISDFETQLASVARARKCEGIICGHIHTPADKMIDGIHYLNSGDWVESLTALAETETGEWKIIHYKDWFASLEEKPAVPLHPFTGTDNQPVNLKSA
ncbi:MAG: calcineurin-like phosphoesterase [Bacteroidetes bacterium]|nr:MAG: calcineurin-like phosphoesterase [Bacteroidota bacterium]